MSSPIQTNPGHLYQISREAESTCGLENLHIFLLPPACFGPVEPLRNERLKSLLNDAEVIVFENPVEPKKADPIGFACNALRTYCDETALRRMGEVLSLDCADKESLVKAIVDKIFQALPQSFPCAPQEPSESGKAQLFNWALAEGKTIEYIDERDTLSRFAKSLFEGGLLEAFLASALPNEAQPPSHVSSTPPPAVDRARELYKSEVFPSEAVELSLKISHYLSTNKNTLFILEDSSRELQLKLRVVQELNAGLNVTHIA